MIIKNLLIMLRSIVLTVVDVFGEETVKVVEVAEDKEYKDGKPTGNVLGSKYTCIIPTRGYDRVVVKVPSSPIFTQEDLDKVGALPVKFSGFKASFYIMNGNLGLSCKAESVAAVKAGKE